MRIPALRIYAIRQMDRPIGAAPDEADVVKLRPPAIPIGIYSDLFVGIR